MQRIERHFGSLAAAGAVDMVDALAFRAAERPEALACLLIERDGDPAAALSYADLLDRARRAAGALAARAGAGDRVVLALPASPDFLVALFGCFIAGLIAVPAPPLRGARGQARLAGIVGDCGAALLVTDAPARAPHTGAAVHTPADLDGPPRDCGARNPEALALLQYTSGSTGAPKGVAIPHRAIWHNQAVIRTSFDHAEGVVLVGWLPNFHDMGLIGNLLQPLYAGGLTVMMEPAAFVQKPLRWLRAIDRYGAHTSGAPNFAYDLCVRAAEDVDLGELDLSRWRVAFNGAEPVRAETMDRFASRFAAHGFRRESLLACYGLAESTLMVSGAPVDAPPFVLRASKKRLAKRILAPAGAGEAAHALVACGEPVAGAARRLADAQGEQLPDGAVGEIQVRSPSVCAGYWGHPRDGDAWLRTGDLGAMLDGRLYVVGRLKDVIIAHGRNVHPHDIEAAVEPATVSLGGARAACAGADTDAGERPLLFVELARPTWRAADVAAIETVARQAASEAAETALHGVVVLRPGAMLLTSSGKVRRRALCARFLAGELVGVIHCDPGAARLQRDALAGEANTR